MNKKIFDTAKKFERILKESMSEIQELGSKTGNISQENYIKYALADRKKIFNILRNFFEEEGRDDFITLFGVYCNFYIRGNYNLVLPEKNFGISELWDVITEGNFQKYLLLIQEGIYEQKEKFFESALKIKEFKGYSLPHLYLFIFSVQKYDKAAGEDKRSFKKQKDFLDDIYEHYNKMNPDLREYVLGAGEFVVRENFNPALDENFLPYVKVVDFFQDFTFDVIRGALPSYTIYRNFHDCHEIYRVVSTIRKGYDEFKKIVQDDFKKYPEAKNMFDSIFGFLDVICPPENNLTEEQSLQFFMAQNTLKEKLDLLSRLFLYNGSNKFKKELASAIRSSIPLEWRDDGVLAHKLAYLKIPVRISNAGSFLLDQMEKLKLQKKRDALVRDFTHRYKNLKATRLGEIAESLLKMEDEQEKKWGRELLLEQARKETLTKEATMLHMRYSGDIDRLIKSLKNSLADDGEGISDVLQMTALNCFVEFFYDETGDDAEVMREQLSRLWTSLDDKKISFERQVIFDKKNTLDWLKENGLLLKIEFDECWQKISLNRNDYAEIFLRAILLEMLKNFLKHGEAEKPLELIFHSAEKVLRVSMRNSISETKGLIPSTKYGLKSMDETLKTLYASPSVPVPENCVRYSQDGEFFSTELEMPAAIFLKGETTDE